MLKKMNIIKVKHKGAQDLGYTDKEKTMKSRVGGWWKEILK